MCFVALGAALAPSATAGMQAMIGATTMIGAAAPLASYAGQRQAARQQARYQAQASAAERARFLQEQTSLRMRQSQQQEATNKELGEIALKSREAISRARTSAGEAGVAGASVDALMDDYMRQEANYRTALLRQQEFQNINTGLALSDAGFRSQSNLIGINRPINRPSFLTAGLSAASGAASGYRTGLDIKAARATTG
jgi:hypothetical protein